jgi:hypothetical protein
LFQHIHLDLGMSFLRLDYMLLELELRELELVVEQLV